MKDVYHMKMTSLFGVAVVCLATSAFAYDMTYILPVKAGHFDSSRVELPEGNSSVTVRASNEKNISCRVTDAATGNPAAPDQNEVKTCYFNARGLVLPHTVYVRVGNSQKEDLQVNIQVVSLK